MGHSGNLLWECVCDCGNTVVVRGDLLRSRNTQSCGCLQKQRSAESSVSKLTTHGMTKSRIYKIYIRMKGRCFNKNEERYPNYGGRGITVCNEWLNSFESFYHWSMEHGYSDKLSIDRINVNGDYCPDNCRWATTEQQQNNKRNNLLVCIDGETDTLSNMCKKFNAKYSTVYTRIKHGTPPKDALLIGTQKMSALFNSVAKKEGDIL